MRKAYGAWLGALPLLLAGCEGPGAGAPTGYGFTGGGTAAAGDGTPDGSTAVSVATTAVSGVNFAVEKRPVANSSTVTAANPGGTLQYPVAATNFTGTDTDA